MDEYDENGEYLVDYAEFGNINAIKNLIENEETDINYKETLLAEFGETALMVSSRENYFEIVEYLLENGANPNIKNDGGDTALMYAVAPKNLDNRSNFRDIRSWDIARLLLENGTNPLIKNNEGKTAYDIVVDGGIINRVKDGELLQELKKYMRIYRIQALRRGNLTRRKLKTSMARRRSALSRLGDTYDLGEDVIQMLNSRMSRPSHIDMIEETPYNM